MQQQSPDDAILYRFRTLEQDVALLKQQLERYVPVRENELQLGRIRDTTERIEREIQAVKQQLEGMSIRLIAQETESQRRDSEQRESQAALQIRVLATIVTTVIGALVAILIGYITHLFH